MRSPNFIVQLAKLLNHMMPQKLEHEPMLHLVSKIFNAINCLLAMNRN
jgi:hypothetical protein